MLMGLFGRKKNVEMPPVEDVPPLPTLETLHKEFPQTQKPVQPQPQMQAPLVDANLVPQPHQLFERVKRIEPQSSQEKSVPKEERPVFAPLFVKIDRYRNILTALGQLRTSVVMVRNSFSTLNELEKARFETLKLIEDAIEKVDKKLASLDTELLRPAGYHTELTNEYQDVETVQATVADLKGQIAQLKDELGSMA